MILEHAIAKTKFLYLTLKVLEERQTLSTKQNQNTFIGSIVPVVAQPSLFLA